jgi:pyruvate/2-oxoglutarate dehydrogenase complex dihydrolipoamide acyltransferase (E2) component
MATEILLPQYGEAMLEGKILKWLKRPGDPVRVGEALVEIETAKADVTVEAPVSGVLARVLVAEGETVPIRAPLAIID